MKKQNFYDLVILLPGLLGSVLSDQMGDVWAPSSAAVWNALTRDQGLDDRLVLGSDKGADYDAADDGLRATSLMWDVHFIPGLAKIDGYTATAQLIRDAFDVTEGTMPVTHPANFYQMPYDWRRDNRFNAYRLKRLIEQALPAWREYSGVRNAKVILIAHSMGGLISRYYLEVLEGWCDCKALITFGTPYRGSVNALNYLSNGYKNLFLNLTEAMRSFPSAYQLLPIYPVVNIGGTFGRVAETRGIPGIDPMLAADALRFHREIETAVEQHESNNEYLKKRYTIMPFVGVQQPTLQSAKLDAGRLTASFNLPDAINSWFGSGDGTVPQVSATPIEMAQAYRDTYLSERHGSLQNNREVLSGLQLRLAQMQANRVGPIRGPESAPDRLALSVGLEDLYLPDEPIEIRVRVEAAGEEGVDERVDVRGAVEQIKATIIPVNGGVGEALHRNLQSNAEGEWILTERGLAPGLYRLEVKAQVASNRQAPELVHDLFAVTTKAA